jgi:hypothetical protein
MIYVHDTYLNTYASSPVLNLDDYLVEFVRAVNAEARFESVRG